MSRLGFLFLVLVLIVSFEWYSFNGLNLVFDENALFKYVYWTTTVITLIGFYKVFIDLRNNTGVVRAVSTNVLLGFGFAVFVTKIVFVGLLLLQDSGRFIIGLINFVSSFFLDINNTLPARNFVITAISAILVSIPFISMLYGITLGKYNYKVEKLNLTFPDLPKAFHGFKIVQLSDIHAGSFDSIEQVKRGVDLIRAQGADLIVFTGDLVNSLKEEINPYIETFATLSAPYGMYSILGNHDYYGMYQVAQKDPIARKIYMDDFNLKHKKIGFKLLNNQSAKVKKKGDYIRLVGVENWGKGPFPKEGNLNKALEGVDKNEFTILLSHDPTHWDYHVLPHPKNIHLTLAGHTHGMQFGINIGNFKWSPVKYRYKRWMGLYKQAGQLLYVNRGFGFLGWPGRVGMSPEITVFELNAVEI
jgi:predicted MPP superfamily phosphohydrolase